MSARPHIVLRDAEREDASALIDLWSECAGASQDEGSEAFTQQALWREPGVAEAAAALEMSLARPDKRIIVALAAAELAAGRAAGRAAAAGSRSGRNPAPPRPPPAGGPRCAWPSR